MRYKYQKTSVLIVGFATFYASSAAADRCQVFVNGDFTGTAMNMEVPAVTATQASGEPLNSTWANTSRRLGGIEFNLKAMNNAVSSAEISALDSDVALYVFDGPNFNGTGDVYHCKKGNFCTVALGSNMNNKAESAICQREFFRKAKDVDATQTFFRFLENPIFNMTQMSTMVDTLLRNQLQGDDGIDAYRSTQSEDGMSLWGRTRWMTTTEYCSRSGLGCEGDLGLRYRDMFQISKRFEIDVNNTLVDIAPFVDDDYVVEANWYMRPVIVDHDNNPSTGNELHAWWASTSLWVEGGSLHDAVMEKAEPKIFDVDSQAAFRGFVLLSMSQLGCAHCADGKTRLQFSIFNDANVGKAVWAESFNMATTHPKMVLNLTRDARYPLL